MYKIIRLGENEMMSDAVLASSPLQVVNQFRPRPLVRSKPVKWQHVDRLCGNVFSLNA